MVLLSETLPPIPLPGIIIIVGFVVALVLACISDSKNRKAFLAKINEMYDGKILEELSGKHYRVFITNEDEFIIGLKSGTCIHRAYKLSDIKYVASFRDISSRQWMFEILDANKKRAKGKTLYANKKKEGKMTSDAYFIEQAEADAYCALVMKYAKHVERYK